MTPTPHNRFNVVGSGFVIFVSPDGGSSTTEWSNCCTTAQKDGFGNCCTGSAVTMVGFGFGTAPNLGSGSNVCTDNGSGTEYITSTSILSPAGYSIPNHLVCVGGSVNWNTSGTATGDFPNGDTATCSGKLMILNQSTGLYFTPAAGATANYATASYNIVGGNCVYGTSGVGVWTPSVSGLSCNKITGIPSATSNDLFISYWY